MLDLPALAELLEDALGWKAEPHDPSTLRAEHETDEGRFVTFIRLNENWLVASVVPFLATRGENSFELSRWLLRMNRDMYQSKFAYDEDGDVLLTVELPRESLDQREIESAFKGLLSYAIEYRGVLRRASGG